MRHRQKLLRSRGSFRYTASGMNCRTGRRAGERGGDGPPEGG